MKKNLLLLILLCSFSFSQAQSWSATHLTNVNYLANTGIESHNGKLYATVFNGFTAGFYRLQANNSAWDTLPTGSITVPRFLRSAGSKLYMSSVISGVSSLVYYTNDGGNTFITDTVGLPPYFGNIALVYGLQYFNGKIIANLGSGGYYLKDTGTIAWHAIPVVTALNGGVDPITGVNNTLFAYDNTGTHTLYYSTDYGTTWNVRNSNLPLDYGTSILYGDVSNNRLYSAGAWNNNTQYGIYYSDDLGITWTIIPTANSFISLNANNTQQLVKSLYANGNTFYMALENNKNSSAPDIVSTISGLANLAYDTLGLPTNASSGVFGATFVPHAGKLALQLNAIDVYLSGAIANALPDIHFSSSSIFPNPGRDYIFITQPVDNCFYSIYNLFGEKIMEGYLENSKSKINISALNPSVYFIKVKSSQQKVYKFVKE